MYLIIHTYCLGPDSEARYCHYLIQKPCLSSPKSDWKHPAKAKLSLHQPIHHSYSLYILSPRGVHIHYSFSVIFMLCHRWSIFSFKKNYLMSRMSQGQSHWNLKNCLHWEPHYLCSGLYILGGKSPPFFSPPEEAMGGLDHLPPVTVLSVKKKGGALAMWMRDPSRRTHAWCLQGHREMFCLHLKGLIHSKWENIDWIIFYYIES